MIYLKTAEEIELLRESCLLVSKTLAELAKLVKPGVSTAQLNKVAEEFILDNGATAPCKGYCGYPAHCTSVNDEIVHGILPETNFERWRHHFIDLCTLKNGFVGDSAYVLCG